MAAAPEAAPQILCVKEFDQMYLTRLALAENKFISSSLSKRFADHIRR